MAAVKISSVRRKAAQKFWAPQQGHPHPPSPWLPCLKGAADRGILSPHRTYGRAHGPCPTKTVVGRHPCVPPPDNRRTITAAWGHAALRITGKLVRPGRCGHPPAPGLAQSSLSSVGADASVRPLPNAPPQKRERPPGRSHLAYVFFTPPGNRLGLRPPAAGFFPGPAHPGAGR